MADVITRLKLESGEYDSKVKRATQGLLQMEQECRNAGKSLATLEKEQKQYVQSLGSMQTVSTTVRGKLGELTQAYTELRVQYNRLTEEEKKGDFGKALSSSLDQLNHRIQQTKKELSDVNKELSGMDKLEAGGLFGGSKISGMLQVFGGNVMTKVAGMATGLVTEMGDAIKQGVELAKQGEGIRIAFERLGRGDILDGLREATHGTVTDLELMKAAVKFNDFKLPLDELGTMLAFAQQKAKDTGQSVDYMVDSIVTGLGRKSLMILDNLGLSAAEIKERMKETGDMTKAVGAIIRDQMAAAGDYVETAADRAAQANVSLQNKMEELGRKFAPVEEASNSLWTSMKIGILDIIGGPLAQLLNGLTETGRLQNAINNMNGGGNGGPTRIDRMVSMLGDGKSARSRNTYNKQLGVFDERINQQQFRIASLSGSDAITRGLRQKAETELKALETMRAEYISRANDVFNPKSTTPLKPTTDSKKGTKEDKDEFTEIIGLIGNAQEKVSDLQRQISESWDEGEIARLTEDLKAAEKELQRLKDIGKDVDLDKLFPEQSISGASKSWAESMRESLISDLGNSMMAADKSAIQNIIKEGFANGIDLTEAGNELMAQLFEGMDVPDDKIKELLENVNEKIRENGGIELTVDTNTGDVSKKKSKGSPMDDTKKVMSGLNQVASGLQQMGIQLPEGVNQVLGVINGVMTILQGISTIIGVTQFAAITANTISLDLLTAAVWANTASSFIPFANGGIVGFAKGGLIGKAASGMLIGNSYSGDNLRLPVNGGGYIGVNAGELILNKAQQGVIADALGGGGASNLGLSVKVTAEELRFILGNNSRRRGKGEYVTTNRLK